VAVSAKLGGDMRATILAAFLGADLHACGGQEGGDCCGPRLPADLTVRNDERETGEQRLRGCASLHLVFSTPDSIILETLSSFIALERPHPGRPVRPPGGRGLERGGAGEATVRLVEREREVDSATSHNSLSILIIIIFAFSYESAAHPRLLKLLLTDGSRQAVAFEFEPCAALGSGNHPDAWAVPGVKIVLTDPPVSGGMLALRPPNLAVLGGRVPRLVEARARALAAHRAPPTGGSVADGTAPSASEAAKAAAWEGVVAAAPQPPPLPPRPPLAAVEAAVPPRPAPPPPPPAAVAFVPKVEPVLYVLSSSSSDDEERATGAQQEREATPRPPVEEENDTPPPSHPPTGIALPPWPVVTGLPDPGASALLRAPPARLTRTTGALSFMTPEGEPLEALALGAVLEVGSVEYGASVSPALIAAALRGEVVEAGVPPPASISSSPPPAATPAELMAFLGMAGAEALGAHLKMARAALTAFGDGWVGVRREEVGGRLVVVGLWWQR